MAITKEKIKKWEEKGKVKKLLKALSVKDMAIRGRVVVALGEIGDSSAVDPLINVLKGFDHSDLDVRSNAAIALGKIGDEKAVAPLSDELFDSTIGPVAADALGNIGGAKVNEPLIKALKNLNSYAEFRRSAAKALGKIGDPIAVDALIEALKDKDISVHRYAVTALGNIGDPKAVDPIIEALEREDSESNYRAVEALGEIGDPKAIEPLSKLLLKQSGFDSHCTWLYTGGILLIQSGFDCNQICNVLNELGWEPQNDEIGAKYYIIEGKYDKCVEIGDPAVGPLIDLLKLKVSRKDKPDNPFAYHRNVSKASASRRMDRSEVSVRGEATEALKSIYQSKKISPKNKKALLKLEKSKLKISDSHTDQSDFNGDTCHTDHTDSIQDIYFEL